MNATKFVVFLLFIGVLCAKFDARKLGEVSKDTELSLSDPKATVKGVAASLSTTIDTTAYGSGIGDVSIYSGPDGPSVFTYGNGYGTTSGSVDADDPISVARSSSGASGSGNANGSIGPDGSTANSFGNGGGSSTGEGSTGDGA